MVFGLRSQVLENALLPVPLHLIPVLDHAVLDRVVDGVRLAVGERLVTDKEVEVFDTALRGEVTGGGTETAGLGRDGGSATTGGGRTASTDAGGDDERRVRVTGETEERTQCRWG